MARAAGFGVESIGVSGNHELSQEEVVELAGLPINPSLPFLDPKALQSRLVSVPLISEASVTKLYPDRLLIDIRERVPYALWQKDGNVLVIAEDGTAIEQLSDPRFLRLPHVVGPDALVPVPGGVLIWDRDGALLGAVGISGDTSDNDEICAVAGIEAAGLIAETGA